MRLLHTADWHVGRAIRGRSRSYEFERALDEVVGIAVLTDADDTKSSAAGDYADFRACRG